MHEETKDKNISETLEIGLDNMLPESKGIIVNYKTNGTCQKVTDGLYPCLYICPWPRIMTENCAVIHLSYSFRSNQSVLSILVSNAFYMQELQLSENNWVGSGHTIQDRLCDFTP